MLNIEEICREGAGAAVPVHICLNKEHLSSFLPSFFKTTMKIILDEAEVMLVKFIQYFFFFFFWSLQQFLVTTSGAVKWRQRGGGTEDTSVRQKENHLQA